MKIAIIQDFLRSGGTERQSILLANAFAAAGLATTLVTFRPGGALQSSVSTKVRRRALQPFDLKLDWFAPGLNHALRAFAPDVVLCMGRMANCAAAGIQHAFPSAAVIGTMRTGKTLPAAFRRSLQRVRHVVANSREARDTLVRHHEVPAAKISVIHNSLVFPPVSADGPATSGRERLRTQHGASTTTVVLLCVAMFRPEKNQRELVELVAGLPPTVAWQLWLAGDGPARRRCEELVRVKNLSERVKFLGFNRDPSSLYAAADIAVHASSSEALSNFLIEAQSHGLPVVAYDAQGIQECFVPGKTGWAIERGDRSAFRSTLLRLFAEPASSQAATAVDARNYARETFDPGRQVAAYLDLFARLSPPAVQT